MNKNNSLLGSLAALFANIIFGFSFLFSKLALAVAHPLIILAVRFVAAFLILNLLWAMGFIKINFKGKPIGKLCLMALAQPLLYFIFELYGINNTSSAISGVIISLVPIAVILLSRFFLKEKATALQIICSVISLICVATISILSNNGTGNTLIGIVLLIGAVICAAVFNILSRSLSGSFSPIERTYMMFLIGSIGFTLISLISLRSSCALELTAAISNANFWIAICYLSVLSSIGAFLLYNYATSNISTLRAASFSNIITVVSVIAGMVFLKEILKPEEIICCAFIILSVFLVNYKN